MDGVEGARTGEAGSNRCLERADWGVCRRSAEVDTVTPWGLRTGVSTGTSILGVEAISMAAEGALVVLTGGGLRKREGSCEED